MKRLIRARRLARVAAKIAWAVLDKHHPVLVHMIPMRRCNLACRYCNEYDSVSAPVPLDVMLRRVDLLAGLGTSAVTISGFPAAAIRMSSGLHPSTARSSNS